MSKHVVLTRKAAMTLGALHGFLKPRLAQDAKLDLTGILAKVTSKNFGAQKPVLIRGITRALDGKLAKGVKLAKDASVEGLATLLDALESEKAMDDPLPLETDPGAGPPMEDPDKSMDDEGGPDHGAHEQIMAFLQDKLSPEDLSAIQQMIAGEAGDAEPEDVDGEKLDSEKGEDEDMDEKDKKGAKDEPPPFKGKPEVGGGMSKDSVNKAIKTAVADERAAARATRDAERFVRPWVGDLAMAHDSAEAVFKTALTALNVKLEGVPAAAYKHILEAQPLPGKAPAQTTFAADSASVESFAKRYPEAARIKFA